MESHQKQHISIGRRLNLVTGLLVVATLGLVVATFLLYQGEAHHEEYRLKQNRIHETKLLVDEFRKWFSEGEVENVSPHLVHLKSWLSNDPEWSSITTPRDSNAIKLRRNPLLRKYFMTFEDAALLHKNDLLDTAYFNNYFRGLFDIMATKTSDPSVRGLITEFRGFRQDKTIWSGYYYCDSVFYNRR